MTTPEPLGPIPVEPQAPRRRPRRKLVAAVSAALGLAVLTGGSVWALDRLGDADRTAPTIVWAEPAEDADAAKPATPVPLKGLGSRLMPVPFGFELGPDIENHGNDTVLGKKQAVAEFKEGSRGLPSDQRKKRNKAIEKLRLQGLAMRSYRDAVDGQLIVEMRLAQIENAKDGRKLAAFQSEFADALGIFRKGPAVKGFKNAKCFLTPKDSEDKLDVMFCSAYQGDVLISLEAYGPMPMNTSGAAELLRKQLDHLETPGELV
ncbi:hypothetical protein [Streptomyces sp. NPDC051219]|uniref:hypothetical protein n=1 Tax=Streptomyces sp. NPDC051219 TaxID=3155283 RepID=UPI00343A3AEA